MFERELQESKAHTILGYEASSIASEMRLGEQSGNLPRPKRSLFEEGVLGFKEAPRADVTSFYNTMAAMGSEGAARIKDRREEEELWRQDLKEPEGAAGNISRTIGGGVYQTLKIGAEAVVAGGIGSAFAKASRLTGAAYKVSKAKAGGQAFTKLFGADIASSTYGNSYFDYLNTPGVSTIEAHMGASANTIANIVAETALGGGALVRSAFSTGGATTRIAKVLERMPDHLSKRFALATMSPTKAFLSGTIETVLEEVGENFITYPSGALIDLAVKGTTDASWKELGHDMLFSGIGSIPLGLVGGGMILHSSHAARMAVEKIDGELKQELTPDRAFLAYNKKGDLQTNPELAVDKVEQFTATMDTVSAWLTDHLPAEDAKTASEGLALMIQNAATLSEDVDPNDIVGSVVMAFANGELDVNAVREAVKENGTQGLTDYLVTVDENFKSTILDLKTQRKSELLATDAKAYSSEIKTKVGVGYSEQEAAVAANLSEVIEKRGFIPREAAKKRLGESLYKTLAIYGDVNNVDVEGEKVRVAMSPDGGVLIMPSIEGMETSAEDSETQTLRASAIARNHSSRVSAAERMWSEDIPASPSMDRMQRFKESRGSDNYVAAMSALYDLDLSSEDISNMSDEDLEALVPEVSVASESPVQSKAHQPREGTTRISQERLTELDKQRVSGGMPALQKATGIAPSVLAKLPKGTQIALLDNQEFAQEASSMALANEDPLEAERLITEATPVAYMEQEAVPTQVTRMTDAMRTTGEESLIEDQANQEQFRLERKANDLEQQNARLGKAAQEADLEDEFFPKPTDVVRAEAMEARLSEDRPITQFDEQGQGILLQEKNKEALGFYDPKSNWLVFSKNATAETILHEWTHHLLSAGFLPPSMHDAIRQNMGGTWDDEKAVEIISSYMKELAIPSNASPDVISALKSLRSAFAHTTASMEVNDKTKAQLDAWTQGNTLNPTAAHLGEAVRHTMEEANASRYDINDAVMFMAGKDLENLDNGKVRSMLMGAFRGDRAKLAVAIRAKGINITDETGFLTEDNTPEGYTHDEVMAAAREVLSERNKDSVNNGSIGQILDGLEELGVSRAVLSNPEFQQLVMSMGRIVDTSHEKVKKIPVIKRTRIASLIDRDLSSAGVINIDGVPISSLLNEYRTKKSRPDAIKALNKALSEKGLNPVEWYEKEGATKARSSANAFMDEHKDSLIAALTSFPADEDSRVRAVGGNRSMAIMQWVEERIQEQGIVSEEGGISRALRMFTDWYTVLNDISDGNDEHAIINSIGKAMVEMQESRSKVESDATDFMKDLNDRVGALPLNMQLRMVNVEGVGKISWDKLLYYYGHSRGDLSKDSNGQYKKYATQDLFMSDVETGQRNKKRFESIVKAATKLVASNKQAKTAMTQADEIFNYMWPMLEETKEYLTGEKPKSRFDYFPSLRTGKVYTSPDAIEGQFSDVAAKNPIGAAGVTSRTRTRVDAKEKGQPLVSFGFVLQQYMQQAYVYAGSYKHIMKMQMLLDNEDVTKAFKVAGKGHQLDLMKTLLDREKYVNGRTTQLSLDEQIVRNVVSRWRWALLSYRMPIAFIQVMSAPAQIGRLPGGFGGIKHALVGAKAGIDVAASLANGTWEKSDIYRTMRKHNSRHLHARHGHYMLDMAHSHGGVRGIQMKIGGTTTTIGEFGVLPLAIGDKLGRIPAWWAAYQFKLNEQIGNGIGRSDAENAAATFAETETSITQPGGIVSDRNLAQTQNEWVRAMIPFTGFWMKMWSMIRVDGYRPMKRAINLSRTDGKFDGYKLAGNLMRVMVTGQNVKEFGTNTSMVKKFFWSVALPALSIGIIRRGAPPKDENEYFEDLLAFSLMGLPIFGTAFANKMVYSGAEGSFVPTQAISDISRLGSRVLNKAGIGDEVKGDLFEDFISASKYFGMPAEIFYTLKSLKGFEDLEGSLPAKILETAVRSQATSWEDNEEMKERWHDPFSIRERQ